MKKFGIRVLFFLFIEKIVSGVYTKNIWTAIWTSVVYGLVNTLIKPVLVFFSIPINLITFGLFNFIINGYMIYLTSKFYSGFEVDSFGTAVLLAILISIVQSVLLDKK